ncbi:CMGC/CDK/CRK7 protein kinase [Saprolegnia parasitica CBS 223.65]|uniref:Cyclin-dependent kinase 2 homolog n=1 Tax=Saprolegnia parasitica (strain CBS 223.65) TaxID=695850 RepID=A0A067CLE1_SAPPC|nr:CMGC/CDK/CRK7 protein kinase [Saprolegnia parasitica CBS 223.65]KDO31519.1 CMGC/CDK/CRK7 protein kinase [Saprolegnia parasitica CBS 223.65]|eukprot:XP_012197429.1 CMGC/CDK/CRK7 protein kinase [Saprolegnia parasitica CBS 223.65]
MDSETPPPPPPLPVLPVEEPPRMDPPQAPAVDAESPPPPPPADTPPPLPVLSPSPPTSNGVGSSPDVAGHVSRMDDGSASAAANYDPLSSLLPSKPTQSPGHAPKVDANPPTNAARGYMGLIENYTIIDKVGSGTYGEVYKCQHKITKDIVALKKLRQEVEKNGFPITSIREMRILKQLKHPNIVELKEIVSKQEAPKDGKKPPLYFAFEYMEHDLSGLLNHEKVPRFTRTQVQCYMRQLLTGVAFMHGHKIMHRDIKASNLLLNNEGMLKIADFGLSRFWNEVNAKGGRYTNKVVTLWYRPPELLMGSQSYDYSIDIWSVGCIFAELLLGRAPMQGRNELEQLQCIYGLVGVPTKDNWPNYDKLPNANVFTPDAKHVHLLSDRFKDHPPATVDLLAKMLTLDPAKRITALDALDHDYFWKVPTCKPRELPKFVVASTHEYQSKKRQQEEAKYDAPSKRHHGAMATGRSSYAQPPASRRLHQPPPHDRSTYARSHHGRRRSNSRER